MPLRALSQLRRGIIRRASVGGQQLRNRLFSRDEIYKAALTTELVQLGIAPSPSSDAVNEIWKEKIDIAMSNGGQCPLYLQKWTLVERVGTSAFGGEFNRSTQHYSLERSGHGAGAIPPLRAKILDTALVPRALG